MVDHGSPRTELRQGDPRYPEALACISDPPRCLYCVGDVSLLETTCIAIVGARKATPYGIAATRLFGGWAGSQGVTLVSGAAMGCDQEAHRTALEIASPTIAVLGCGADVDYPAASAELLSAVRREGLVVSELPWGTSPQRWTFVRRNRIIAALATVLIVVEASLPSGTFTTAEYALDYGKSVMAVPGSIFAQECRGANRLISQGAIPLTDISDLALLLGESTCQQLSFPDGSDDSVFTALLANPMRPDDLARALASDIVAVARHLGTLERQGVITRYPDGRYGPCEGSVRQVQSSR